MVTCTRCDAVNPPGTSFCRQCDHFLSWEDPPPDRPSRAQVDSLDHGLPVLPAPLHHDRAKPAPPRAAPDPVTPPPGGAGQPSSTVEEIVGAIEEGRSLASDRGRGDLAQHLDRTRERLVADPVPVVVVGEFKMGKSSLINALLQDDICAVGADVLTAVPTMVRYAERAQVTRYLLAQDGRVLEEEQMPLEALSELVTQQVDSAATGEQRTLTVGHPHRILGAGLALVDTPGVGGLDSPQGQLTLGALRQAEGVLFVSAATQELTEPELEFLRTSAERCGRIALVMTKIDICPRWRRLAEINSGHLRRAGLDIPIIPISSVLRRRAAREPDLNDESGFGVLVTFLARDVVLAARSLTARSAAAEVDFVATQLQRQTQAERTVIAAPETVSTVVAQLSRVEQQATQLASATANWRTTLGDGVAQLEADVSHDLQQRLREVIREVEEIIDRGDPKDAWDDIDGWLRRELALAVVANRDLLTSRAEELSARVALQFAMPSSAGLELELDVRGEVLDSLSLGQVPAFSTSGVQLMSVLNAARSGYLPVMLGTAAAGAVHVLSGAAAIAAPPLVPFMIAIFAVSAALGGGLGAKTFSSERLRQKTARQAAAKVAVQRFVRDDVAPVVSKQTADALRRTRQLLRDDFTGRAHQLERTAREAMTSAREAGGLRGQQQEARERELATQQRRLDEVRSTARQVASGDIDG